MRTTVNIPDEDFTELLQYSKARSYKEAVVIAIREWVRQKKLLELRQLRGKLDIEDALHNF